MRNITLAGFLIFFSLNTQSQNQEFKSLFEQVTQHIYKGNFSAAIEKLNTLNQWDPQNSNVLFQLGYCYLQAPVNPQKAISNLEKASANITINYQEGDARELKAPIEVFKYLADAYHLNYQFETAITTYERFLKELNPKAVEQKKLIQEKIDLCKQAQEIKNYPLNMQIFNLGPYINSSFPDYNPCLSGDESTLVFTSRRAESTGGIFEENGQYFEDILITHKVNGKWETPKPISSSINTEGHESAVNLSTDGQTLILYKYGLQGQGDLYTSKLIGNEWSIPSPLASDINSSYWEGNASISSDGKLLFFSSNRPGGMGGKDLYYCKKLPNDQWALAQNCGPGVNTSKDEDAPFIHPNGNTLFFSSNGHKTMGGYDVFFAEKMEEGSWGDVQNIGYPVNTPADDIHFKPTLDRKHAIYASFRSDGFGDYDLYMITFPDVKEEPLTVLKGSAINESGQVIEDLIVNVYDKKTQQLLGAYTPNIATGKYIIILNPGKEYTLEYEGKQGVIYTESISIPNDSSYRELDRAVQLPPVKINHGSKK